MENEEWKTVPSAPGYEVSNFGRVRSKDRFVQAKKSSRRGTHLRFYKGKILSPGRASSGHMTVACGKGVSRYVHELVLEAFVGPRPTGLECLHADDVPSNNKLGNLRWGTRSENMLEAYANGCR